MSDLSAIKLNGTTYTLSDDYARDSMAKIEYGTLATKAYAVGDFLINNNHLYKVTSAIAIGVKFVVGTNIELVKLSDEVKLKAPLASPTFTGTPKVPTASTGTKTTQIASTAYVQNEIDIVNNNVQSTIDYVQNELGGVLTSLRGDLNSLDSEVDTISDDVDSLDSAVDILTRQGTTLRNDGIVVCNAVDGGDNVFFMIDDTLTEAHKAADAKATGNAISSLNEDITNIQSIIGDPDQLIGEGQTLREDKVNFTNGSTHYDTNSWVLTISEHHTVNVDGTVPSNKFITLQDLTLPAGDYEISSETQSSSSAWFFQIMYMEDGAVGRQMYDSTSSVPVQISLDSATDIRIRIRIIAGSFTDDANTIAVEKITVIPPGKYDNIIEALLAHDAAVESAESIGDLSDLDTTYKADLVGAINEVKEDIPSVDATLSVEGSPADAKATGDAFDGINTILGDVDQLIGAGKTTRTDCVEFTNGGTWYDTNSWKLTISNDHDVNVNGTVVQNKFINLQDITLPAGDYEISSANQSSSSEWFFQIVNFVDGVVGSQIFDSSRPDALQVTLNAPTPVRIRLRVLAGTYTDENNSLSVEKITVIPPGKYTDITDALQNHDESIEDIAESCEPLADIGSGFDQFKYEKNVYSGFTNGTTHYQNNAFDVIISDGKNVEVNGQPSANLNITLQTISLPAGNYDLEYKINSGSSDGYYIVQLMKSGASTPFVSIETSSMSTASALRNFTLDTDTDVVVRLRVLSGITYTNLSTMLSLYNHKYDYMFDSFADFMNHMTAVYTRVGGQTILATSDRPICTLIDDDTTTVANVQRYTDACEACGVTGTLATLTSKWESNQSLLDELLDAEQRGHRIIIHAYSQNLNDCWHDKDVDLCRANLVKGIQQMRKAGLGNPNFWVTPNNVADASFTEMAKELGLTARFIGNDTYNAATHHNRYYINRIGLDKTAESLAVAKTKADACYAANGWLVVMTHFYNWEDTDVSIFTEFVEYCKTLGFNMESVEEAWYHKRHTYNLYEAFTQY